MPCARTGTRGDLRNVILKETGPLYKSLNVGELFHYGDDESGGERRNEGDGDRLRRRRQTDRALQNAGRDRHDGDVNEVDAEGESGEALH